MWYVIQVTTGEENRTCQRCKNLFSTTLFCDVFVPMYVRQKKYQGVWKEECKVLFPGYLFVDTDEPEIVEEELMKLTCMAKPVCIGSSFVPLEVDEQEMLEQLLDVDSVVQTSTGYIVDGTLLVTQGPLQGMEQYVKRIDRHKRIAEMEIPVLHEMRKTLVGLEVVAKVTKEEFEGMRVRMS
ncbi:MAG: antiterminator LoaP [Lachnospiraceae bacterium]